MKTKIRVTFADIVIILFLVLLIVFVIFKTASIKPVSNNGFEVYNITVRASMSDEYTDNIHKGDSVIDKIGNTYIGTVEDIVLSDYIYIDPLNGETVILKDKVTADITFTARVSLKDGSLILGNKSVIIGEALSLATPKLYFNGVCIDFEKVDFVFPNDRFINV